MDDGTFLRKTEVFSTLSILDIKGIMHDKNEMTVSRNNRR